MGVRIFRDFVGDFGSMMMGGGEVGRLDLRFGVGEGTGSVGWEGGFFDGRTGAGGTFSLRSSIKRWRRIGGKNGARRLPGWAPMMAVQELYWERCRYFKARRPTVLKKVQSPLFRTEE